MATAHRVVVITGASSGIGRAAARRMALAGDRVVIAARGEDSLSEAAAEIEAEGGEVLVVPTDVTDPHAVERLANAAIDRFGHLDVWINNAAVSSFGRFDETPLDAFRKVLETNILGYVHGARAALTRFRKQRHGVLINVASVAADLTQPYTAPYVMSKHAIRAMSGCLRQELLLDGLDQVHVVSVLPPSVDTPLFQHAANYTGRAVQPMPPIYTADRAAAVIERASWRPRREAFVGVARGAGLGAALFPARFERRMAQTTEQEHLRHDELAPIDDGNLFRPEPGAISGGWKPARGAVATVAGSTLAALAVGALVLAASTIRA